MQMGADCALLTGFAPPFYAQDAAMAQAQCPFEMTCQRIAQLRAYWQIISAWEQR